jgi:hypothetical protein
MAFNYKIDQGNGLYYVKETTTEQIIKCFSDKEPARQFMKHLNFGGGFDGWTPMFFLKKFKNMGQISIRDV